jgi:hypothetical protein
MSLTSAFMNASLAYSAPHPNNRVGRVSMIGLCENFVKCVERGLIDPRAAGPRIPW